MRIHNNCSGAVLVISLLFLLVMTFLGISATQLNVLQERMVHNLADHSRAFYAAEAGLNDARSWLLSIETDAEPIPSPNGESHIWERDHLQDLNTYNFDWTRYGIEMGTLTGNTPLESVAEQPRWIVEFESRLCDDLIGACREGRNRTFYKITSKGVGAMEDSVSVLQAIVEKRYQ